MEVWGSYPLVFTFEKSFFFLGKISPFFEKKIGDNFYFFGFSGANLTNFSKFLINFRKKNIHPKTEKKTALFNSNVEKYLFYRICIGFASKQC